MTKSITLGAVSRAGNISLSTVASLVERGLVDPINSRRPGRGRGLERRLRYEDAFALIVAGRLTAALPFQSDWPALARVIGFLRTADLDVHFSRGETLLVMTRRQAWIARPDAVFTGGKPVAAVAVIDLQDARERFEEYIEREEHVAVCT